MCHAYQILRAHGVADDHIVVMMYDDIAHNEKFVSHHLTTTDLYNPVYVTVTQLQE